MTESTLNTSGSVPAVDGGLYYFAELDPFCQGYVEALFASQWESKPQAAIRYRIVGFSDLAPEALAMILRDCATVGLYKDRKSAGRMFWTERSANGLKSFQPLAPYLGDDGRVYLREAGASA